MQRKSYFIMFLFLCGFLLPPVLSAHNFFISDTTTRDSIKTPQPDFSNVNVIVETAWGTSDKSVNVDAFVVFEGKKPSEIILKKGEHQECSIDLIDGLVVKIINPKTGRLLKQFGKIE